jgi:DNA-binding XRE family transcriptional regulator
MTPEEMREMYEQGSSFTVVAKAAGVSRETARKYILQAGGEARPRERAKLNLRRPSNEDLARLYEECGQSQHELSRRIGVARSAIREWLIEAGILEGKPRRKYRRRSETSHYVPVSVLREVYAELCQDDLNLEILSMRIGVSWKTMNLVAGGEGEIRYETADKFVRALGHPMDWYRPPLCEHYWSDGAPESALKVQKWLASGGV